MQPPIVESLQITATEPVEIPSEYWRVFMAPVSSSIDFPIEMLQVGLPLTTLPSFHRLSSNDPDKFLFEFDIFF